MTPTGGETMLAKLLERVGFVYGGDGIDSHASFEPLEQFAIALFRARGIIHPALRGFLPGNRPTITEFALAPEPLCEDALEFFGLLPVICAS
jgi:hypothetical protein